MNETFCCEEFKDFYESLDGLILPVDEGEISGSVYLVTDPPYLVITDGWNYIPILMFRFCPYCGQENPVRR